MKSYKPKPYCVQPRDTKNKDCTTCSLTNYEKDCQNNPINQQPVKRLKGYAATMAAYDGHHGPVTIQAVLSQIPAELKKRLTGHELGLVMSAVNAAYHNGRASHEGKEQARGDMVMTKKELIKEDGHEKHFSCITNFKFNPPDETPVEFIESQFNHGGRTHYIVYCPSCDKTHEYISEEWGVIPNQPALGWQED